MYSYPPKMTLNLGKKKTPQKTILLPYRGGMLHLCASTVAGLAMRRDSVLASRYEYPPFRYPCKPAPKQEI